MCAYVVGIQSDRSNLDTAATLLCVCNRRPSRGTPTRSSGGSCCCTTRGTARIRSESMFGFASLVCLAMLIVACSTHSNASVITGPVPASPNALTKVAQTAPLMSVSIAQGTVGTQVLLTVTDCAPHGGKPDQITWQGAAPPGAVPATRALSGVQRNGNELHATYTVLPADAAGQGIFDAVCGSHGDHAGASFTVVAP